MLKILLLLLMLFPAAAYAQTAVDTELVLSVDTSTSIEIQELHIQRQGYADALVSPEFLDAVSNGPNGKIVVLYYEWGSHGIDNDLGWHEITGKPSAEILSNKIRTLVGDGARGMTYMFSGVRYGITSMEDNEYSGRMVVDVSADGRNDETDEIMPEIQQYARTKNITINGLAIMLEPGHGPFNNKGPSDQYLDKYMEECVKAGSGSFVMVVRDTADFGTVIRKKMEMELMIANHLNWLDTQPQFRVTTVANIEPKSTICEFKYQDMGDH